MLCSIAAGKALWAHNQLEMDTHMTNRQYKMLEYLYHL